MNEQTRAKISALVDGELGPQELKALVKRLSESPDLQGDWASYHLIGDAIRGEPVKIDYERIADSVRERLLSEPTILAPPARRSEKNKYPWLKPAVGSALAASVAVMAVIVSPQLFETGSPQPQRVASSDVPVSATYGEIQGTRWNLNKPGVESKLHDLLASHAGSLSSSSMRHFAPYATFVSYDSER